MGNLTENDFQRVADLLGIEVAVLKAIQAVEAGGRGGFVAPGRPVILFEGHISFGVNSRSGDLIRRGMLWAMKIFFILNGRRVIIMAG